MEYLEIANSVILVILAVLYFVQDRTLKYMKTAMDTINPEKIKAAQQIIDEAKEYEVKLKVSAKTKEIIAESGKRFQEVNKDFLAQYNELMNFTFGFLCDKDWQDREKILSHYPKNADTFRLLLEAYDKGEFPQNETEDKNNV